MTDRIPKQRPPKFTAAYIEQDEEDEGDYYGAREEDDYYRRPRDDDEVGTWCAGLGEHRPENSGWCVRQG